MSRLDDTPELAEEIAKPELRPFLGVHIDLPDPVFAVTGNATIQFNGEEWTAVGGIGSIDTIGESTDGSAAGVKATLYKIPSEFRDDLKDQATRGCLYELWVGALDAAYRNVIGFKLLWKGRLDTYDITDGGDTLSVAATGESRQIDQKRPAVKRLTNWFQQRKFPGDRGLEYVSAMTEVPILWMKGRQTT